MKKAWVVHHWVLQSPIVCPIEIDAINLKESLNQLSGESGGRSGYMEEVEIDFAYPPTAADPTTVMRRRKWL